MTILLRLITIIHLNELGGEFHASPVLSFLMRGYIRHPFGYPIQHRFIDSEAPRKNYLRNVSEGGLCFQSDTYIAPGQLIQIKIPNGQSPFESTCLVAWCSVIEDGFDVGVTFADKDKEYAMRLIEQACYIEEYRKEVLSIQGRQLSEEEAAKEWIDKYASAFPE